MKTAIVLLLCVIAYTSAGRWIPVMVCVVFHWKNIMDCEPKSRSLWENIDRVPIRANEVDIFKEIPATSIDLLKFYRDFYLSANRSAPDT